MESDRSPLGRHRGRRPSDLDWLDHHHGDRYLPRHGEAKYIPRHLCRELTDALLALTAEQR